MSSKEIILDMLKDVKEHQRDQNSLLAHYVQLRLNRSLEAYYKSLMDSFSSLSTFDEMKVLKKLTKQK